MTRYIQTENPHETAFKLPWMDDRLEWNDDQTAPVDAEDEDAVDPDVADRLVEERDDITDAGEKRCQTTLDSGDTCGRPLPCQYHSDDEDGGESDD